MRRVRVKTNKYPVVSRTAQLQQRRLCRDQACAEQVAEAFDQAAIVQHAAGLARGILLSYFQHGAIGRLTSADCPYVGVFNSIAKPEPALSVELLKTGRDTISRSISVTSITNVLFMNSGIPDDYNSYGVYGGNIE